MSKKLKDFEETYYAFTAKASEVNRQLALAGVGMIWIFKKSSALVSKLPESQNLLPPQLLLPLFFLALSLTLDLIQYFFGSIAWLIFTRCKERSINKTLIMDDNIKAPSWIGITIDIVFFLKIISMAIAYAFLFRYLIPKL